VYAYTGLVSKTLSPQNLTNFEASYLNSGGNTSSLNNYHSYLYDSTVVLKSKSLHKVFKKNTLKP
jgi:hypothetical protein